jgi:fumarate hydratase subunit beta
VSDTIVRLELPLAVDVAQNLRAGDQVLLNGIIFTGRDAAHKRLCAALDAGEQLPVNLAGQIIYYAGPAPAPPGKPVGSVGPTTSSRMDAYAPQLLEQAGLRGMIGKGPRSAAVVGAMVRAGAVYFAAIGGAGALMAAAVQKATVAAYPELGPEAIYRLEVRDFPVIVAIDSTVRAL